MPEPGAHRGRTRMNAPTPPTAARRPVSREMSKILADSRDLAIHRLLLTFTTLLDKVGDMLMERAGRTDVREEQQMLLDARLTLKSRAAEAPERVRAAAAHPRQRHHRRQGVGEGRLLEGRGGQPDARRHVGDGRVGDPRQHHARHREHLLRRAADAQSRDRPPPRPARPRDPRRTRLRRRRSSRRSPKRSRRSSPRTG